MMTTTTNTNRVAILVFLSLYVASRINAMPTRRTSDIPTTFHHRTPSTSHDITLTTRPMLRSTGSDARETTVHSSDFTLLKAMSSGTRNQTTRTVATVNAATSLLDTLFPKDSTSQHQATSRSTVITLNGGATSEDEDLIDTLSWQMKTELITRNGTAFKALHNYVKEYSSLFTSNSIYESLQTQIRHWAKEPDFQLPAVSSSLMPTASKQAILDNTMVVWTKLSSIIKYAQQNEIRYICENSHRWNITRGLQLICEYPDDMSPCNYADQRYLMGIVCDMEYLAQPLTFYMSNEVSTQAPQPDIENSVEGRWYVLSSLYLTMRQAAQSVEDINAMANMVKAN